MMKKTISGYIGTETFPTCKTQTGWYVISEPFDISTADLNWFKSLYDKENGNRRNVQPTTETFAIYQFTPLLG